MMIPHVEIPWYARTYIYLWLALLSCAVAFAAWGMGSTIPERQADLATLLGHPPTYRPGPRATITVAIDSESREALPLTPQLAVYATTVTISLLNRVLSHTYVNTGDASDTWGELPYYLTQPPCTTAFCESARAASSSYIVWNEADLLNPIAPSKLLYQAPDQYFFLPQLQALLGTTGIPVVERVVWVRLADHSTEPGATVLTARVQLAIAE
jgi:hypothetical protein